MNQAHSALKVEKDGLFWSVVVMLVVIDYMVCDRPQLAMWFGFMVAGISAIGNDSLQTLGTFIASNRRAPWWLLQLFVGGILVVTLFYSWWVHHGDITYGRLSSIPQPTRFNFLELAAPIALVIMTQLRMPVSTTFLLLSVFSSKVVIEQILIKSLCGYVVAIMVTYLVWGVLIRWFNEWVNCPKVSWRWRVAQFIVTGCLWSLWLVHDMANIVVFLPRTLSPTMLAGVLCFLFAVTGLTLKMRGGNIQRVVDEKTNIDFVRAATIVDFLYAILLLVFKWVGRIPMSTTWVFIGLLAGRELAYRHFSRSPSSTTFQLICGDFLRAGLGLVISLVLSQMVPRFTQGG